MKNRQNNGSSPPDVSAGFAYRGADYNIRTRFCNGSWSTPEVHTEETVYIHMAATCLQYGQQAFEGLKAFRGRDGRIRLFRMQENARRLQQSCQSILIPPLPEHLFCNIVKQVVQLNAHLVPSYESGGALYIRPVVVGLTPRVAVKPAEEFMCMVFASPAGAYFPEGYVGYSCLVCRDFDRAAPKGTGAYKVGGNYAAGFRASKQAQEAGFRCELFLDAKEKRYIDECGAANFFAIKGDTYITPLSGSILPSVTNNSLMKLAKEMGMRVEQRRMELSELADCDEAAACGTAAVVLPICQVHDPEKGKVYTL